MTDKERKSILLTLIRDKHEMTNFNFAWDSAQISLGAVFGIITLEEAKELNKEIDERRKQYSEITGE